MRPTRLPIVGSHRNEALKALSTDPLDNFPAFVEAVSQRLEMGREAYGDVSFDRPVHDLIGELQQEARDLAVGAYVLWVRLEQMARDDERQ
jgi:hypothetical protein